MDKSSSILSFQKQKHLTFNVKTMDNIDKIIYYVLEHKIKERL